MICEKKIHKRYKKILVYDNWFFITGGGIEPPIFWT